MVERHLDLAQRLAALVDEAPDLERLADVPLNIVCFRYRPAGVPEEELDELNARLGEDVLADGRVYVGTTSFGGQVAFRPAIVNWRTRESDIELFVDVVRELGARLLRSAQSSRETAQNQPINCYELLPRTDRLRANKMHAVVAALVRRSDAP